MSEQEFEAYLRLMGRFLRLNNDQRETIGRELRGHMEERLDELLARGYSREDAVNTILDEFGDAAVLAGEFGRIGGRRKWIMRTTVGTVGIAAAVLLVSFLLPENRPLPSPAYSHAAAQVAPTAEPKDAPGEQASAPTRQGLLVGAAAESDADRETREKLAARVSVEFPEGTALEEVLNYLREQGHFSIAVNWNALQVKGIDRTTDTMGMNVKNARIDTVLDMLMENIGGSDASIGYAIVDGIVRISTLEQLDRNAVVRVYDVTDLIHRDLPAAVKDAAKQGLAQVPQPAMSGMMPGATPAEPPHGGGGFAGGGGFGGGGMGASEPANTLDAVIRRLEGNRVGDLQDLITRTIAPSTWNSVGSMSYYDGLLVVSQTTRVHQKLADLLATMRQALAARPSPATDTAGASAGGGFGPVAVAPMRGGFAPPASRPAETDNR